MTGLLLATDFHIDDLPQNEYRWKVFDEMYAAAKKRGITEFYILGDLTDRKNRFTGELVNRLIAALQKLTDLGFVTILAGNHDKPVNGPYYFDFLNEIPGIAYIHEPFIDDNKKLLLLPFSPNPIEEWADIDYGKYKAAFIHQTVSNTVSENGTVLTGSKLPIFPRGFKCYSGDAHVHQVIRGIHYIGCPHPVKFGDTFPNRMLVLDENTYEISEEITLTPPGKLVYAITSPDQLEDLEVRKGDQVRLVFSTQASDLATLGDAERAIAQWAKAKGVTVDGTEVVLPQPRTSATGDMELAPDMVLRDFAESEGISKDMLDIGSMILKEVRG